jgi:hypothetical protein
MGNSKQSGNTLYRICVRKTETEISIVLTVNPKVIPSSRVALNPAVWRIMGSNKYSVFRETPLQSPEFSQRPQMFAARLAKRCISCCSVEFRLDR